MENKTSLDALIDGALADYVNLAKKILDLTASASVDHQSGDPSLRAKGQRSLANFRFKQTTPANDLLKANKQVVMTFDEASGPIEAGFSAMARVLVAILARDAEVQAEDARQTAKAISLSEQGIPLEGQSMIRKCRFPLRSDPGFSSRSDPGEVMSREAGCGSSW